MKGEISIKNTKNLFDQAKKRASTMSGEEKTDFALDASLSAYNELFTVFQGGLSTAEVMAFATAMSVLGEQMLAVLPEENHVLYDAIIQTMREGITVNAALFNNNKIE